MNKSLDIKFVRVVRECDYNKNLKQGEHAIYDFDVLIEGVRRATFQKNIGRGYDLSLKFPGYFEHVKTPKRDGSNLHRVIESPSKAKFLETLQDCIIKGLIPKPEEIERRIAAKKEAADKIAAEAVAEQAAEAQRQRYEQHGPEMLAMIERLRLTINPLLCEIGADDGDPLRRKVIAIQTEAAKLIEKVHGSK